MSICMSKKNTLLYLDENLVKTAKKRNLNISKISEGAIKHHLFTYLSYGEQATIDFKQYIETLKEEKRCFSLPFRLEQIDISQIGAIENLKTNFGKINIFIGDSDSGKTTLVRCIAYMFGFTELNIEHLLKSDMMSGEISLNIDSSNSLVMKLKRSNYGAVTSDDITRCILLDDPGDRLDGRNFIMLLEYLKNRDSQIIMTSLPRRELGELSMDKNVNIYELKE